MQKLRTGIDFKKHSTSPVGVALTYAALPPLARIPLLQHSGPAPELIVKVGEKVSEGQVLAEKGSDLSARVHSSIPGVVSGIVDVTLPNGEQTQLVEIQTGGLFRKTPRTLPRSLESFNKARLLNEFSDRGLVDHSFSALPAHVKYNIEEPLNYLVVRLSDSDPYSAIEEQILYEHADAVCDGLIVLNKLLSPEVIVPCTTSKEPHLISTFIQTLDSRLVNVQPFIVSPLYPGATDEMIKIQLSQNKAVPDSPKHPSIIVVRPSFLYQIQQCVLFGAPIIERPITIAGSGVKKPTNMIARVGTPIRFLLDECGGLRTKTDRIVVGTQQSGFIVTDLDTPIGKDTSMILALTRKEVMAGHPVECNNCGLCNSVCPIGLIPSEAHQAVLSENTALAKTYMLEKCLTCGACSHVCPSRIPLNLLLAEGRKNAQEGSKEANVTQYKSS